MWARRAGDSAEVELGGISLEAILKAVRFEVVAYGGGMRCRERRAEGQEQIPEGKT